MQSALSEINAFLPCPTPSAWLENALADQGTLLIDHAHCEKKAASTAISLMYRYIEYPQLLDKMSRLAREELRHFEQVLAILRKRNITYDHLSPSRYAGGMRKAVRTADPDRLVDLLIVGAFIEARSCERFAAIAPYLGSDLSGFYTGLLKSEARHFQDYLKLAREVAGKPIESRITVFANLEKELVEAPDTEFRFHSGPVAGGASLGLGV